MAADRSRMVRRWSARAHARSPVVNRSEGNGILKRMILLYKGWNAIARTENQLRLCMVLGAGADVCAAGLLGYNRWDAARARKGAEVLGGNWSRQKNHHGTPAGENETTDRNPRLLDPGSQATEVEGVFHRGAFPSRQAGPQATGDGTVDYAELPRRGFPANTDDTVILRATT